MKKGLIQKILDQRVTIFFIVIAALLWFLTRLNKRFTSEIPIDIEIIDDFNAKAWVKNPQLKYTINCEADGRLLLVAKMGLLPEIKVNSSMLKYLQRRDKYSYVIEPNSLKHAVQQKFNNLNVNYIIDSLNIVVVSPIIEKRLPIRSRIDINCEKQYMMVEGVRLEFDSVDVKAPQIVLDSINEIVTEVYKKEHVNSTIRNTVDLMVPENVIAQRKNVGFEAVISPFTEVEAKLKIGVKNAPEGKISVVPTFARVIVKVPLDVYNKQINLFASIDLMKKRKSTLFEVEIDSLPVGAKVILIDPQFVEPLIEKIW